MRVSTRGCLTVVEGFPGHLRGLTCRHVGPHACAHRWQGISDTCAQTRAHAHARGVLHGSRRHGTGRHFRHAVRASTHHDPQKLRYSMQPACSGAQRLCLPTWRGALGGGSPCPPAPPAGRLLTPKAPRPAWVVPRGACITRNLPCSSFLPRQPALVIVPKVKVRASPPSP
jgi:hypothetical protein